jgi:VCBS repeat-containing protein
VAAGNSTMLVRTDTFQDLIDEADETFTLTGVLNSGGTDYSDTATATILDNDLPPQFATLQLFSVTEGDGGKEYTAANSMTEEGSAQYVVLAVDGDGKPLVVQPGGTVTVNIGAAGDTAELGVDYTSAATYLATVGTEFSIAAIDDALADSGETFHLSLADGTWSNDTTYENVVYQGTVETTITDVPLPDPTNTAASVDESAMETGIYPDSTRESTSGSLNLNLPVGWTAVEKTGSTSYGTYHIDIDGTFAYEVTTAPEVAGASTTDVITFAVQNGDKIVDNNTLTITIYDDGPKSIDTDGILKNVVGQQLDGVIDYNMGADGLGKVELSYTGQTLTSHGKTITFSQEDSDNDGLYELVGTADVDGDNDADTVITLAPVADSGAQGSYSLLLSDVIDLPQGPPSEFSVGGIVAGSPTSAIVVMDASTADGTLYVLATAYAGGDEVNANTGELGVENTILNYYAPPDQTEVLQLTFGSDYNTTGGTPTIPDADKVYLNDVTINAVNVGSGTDSFHWYAYKDGALVDDGTSSANPQGGGSYSFGVIHADSEGGFDTLRIEMTSGDFKFAGFTYQEAGDKLPLDLNFSYTATDGDTDQVQGDFNVTLSPSEDTALSSVNIDTLLHTDTDVHS